MLRRGGRSALEMNNYLRLLHDYLPSVVVERDGRPLAADSRRMIAVGHI
jgi:hypothetical protein